MECAGRLRRSRRHEWGRGSATRGRRAFTLIELLVVLGIIMILISMLLPSLRGAREAARTAVCLSNQKQIAAAFSTYAISSKECIPREGTDSWEATEPWQRRWRLSWPVSLRPFLDDRVSSNEDPNDLFANAPYYWDPARPRDNHRVHYVVNAMPMVSRGVVDVDARTNYWHRRGPEALARMRHPSDTLFLTEFSDDGDLSVWNQLESRSREDFIWAQPYDIWDVLHITRQSGQYRICATRHGGAGNATFMDGHAATMKRADLENLDLWDDKDYGVRDESPGWARQ